MRVKIETYFLIFITVIVLVFIGLSLPLSPRARLLPLIIAGITLAFLLKLFYDAFIARRKPEVEPSNLPQTDTNTVTAKDYFNAGLWLAGYALGVYAIGLVISTGIFVLSYLKSHGMKWITSIAYALVTVGLLYYLFQYLMRVDFPEGRVIELIFTLLGF